MMNQPRPEHPRPDRMRQNWKNLNGSWEFCLYSPENTHQKPVYDQQITVPFSWVSPLSGIETDQPGIGWYRCEAAFTASGRIWLCIGAADYDTTLFINGRQLARHEGGYTPFETDVTDAWHMNKSNVIEVRCEDLRHPWQQRGKQGYGDCQGIWQTVFLESRPASYIDSVRIDTKLNGQVDIDITPGGQPCAGKLTASFGKYRSSGDHQVRLQIDNPLLWSPDSPTLYEGTLSLETRHGIDTINTYFGIREISAMRRGQRAYSWIMLNNKPIYINGVLDQSFYEQGHFTAPSDDEIRDDVWRLKRLGINLSRIHIKAEEPRKLYWMDKLGMLVMEDIPCFHAAPTPQAIAAYEAQWPQMILRDINHPSIISFVMFNETWGLFTGTPDNNRAYLPKTRQWVRDVYLRAKQLDPSRLIEDNSPCNYDHTVTDLNTWHFYIHGYQAVRDHIRKVVENTFEGSAFNHAEGFTQTGAPLLNSECGMVWGVDNTAGDSDLAWQYHYMLNEYRLHEKICGFIFTEFHDVVNEFNGYYRIDNTEKDFGYQAFCRGMQIRDLHAPDFVAIDAAPCITTSFGEQIDVPLVISSFSDVHHGKPLQIRCELWHEALDGRVRDWVREIPATITDFGTQPAIPLLCTMPAENALAVLSVYLMHEDHIISRNFTTFDVRGEDAYIHVPVTQGKAEGFSHTWTAMDGQKACFGGSGTVSYTVDVSSLAWPSVHGITLHLEAGAKRVLPKDETPDEIPHNFFNGRNTDRGTFKNSYYMTDESRHCSKAEVWIDDQRIDTLFLSNDFADARGVLSWHAQKKPRALDEAGSYGQAFTLQIPSRLIPAIVQAGRFTLSLQVSPGGLALYDRGSGRYPFGIVCKAW